MSRKTSEYEILQEVIEEITRRFARNRLPKSPIREVLLLEDDNLDAATFLARLPVWLKLINMPNLGK